MDLPNMRAEEVEAIIAICTALFSLYYSVYVRAARDAKIELKVDTIWEFLVRRSLSEAVDKNIASFNSPITVLASAKLQMVGKDERLKRHYKSYKNDPSIPELMIDIEKKFGSELMKDVCLPKRLSHGACLLLAAAVARDGLDGDSVMDIND